MGGLSRRMAVLEEHRKSIGEGLLLVDSGNLFTCESKTSCAKPGKVEEIFKSYHRMSYDAINLSQGDLVLGIPLLREKQKTLKLPFISANLAAQKTGEPLFKPYEIRKVGEITIAILGLMAQLPPQKLDPAYVIKNPSDATHEMLSILKAKADLIIALSSLSRESNVKLLEDFPDLNFIISTDERVQVPTRIQNGYILSSGNRGKYLGRLDLSLSSLENPLQLQDMKRKISLKNNLTRLEQTIAGLEEKKEDVLKSDNDQTHKRYKQELERLRKQKEQYREETTNLVQVDNYFTSTIIPLADQPSKKAPNKMSPRTQAKASVTGRQAIGPGPHIKISNLDGETDRQLIFILTINQAPNEVRALGFDVVYNPQVLKYSKYVKGELVKKFDMFDARKLQEGLLRIGGFEARDDLIGAGKSGELISLHFIVIGKGKDNLHLVRLKDDISSWGVDTAQKSGKKDVETTSELKNTAAGQTSFSQLSEKTCWNNGKEGSQ